VKLEVLGDPETLFPHMPETLEAAKTLVAEGFEVMAYCSDDPIMAKQLEELGCVAVMPLASAHRVGHGHPQSLEPADHPRQRARAGARRRGDRHGSDAAIAMELGCDGVLMNTAIAKAKDPVRMGRAMKLAVEAGAKAFLAGRMAKKPYEASASSPATGLIQKTG
jgi:thiazole synthase